MQCRCCVRCREGALGQDEPLLQIPEAWPLLAAASCHLSAPQGRKHSSLSLIKLALRAGAISPPGCCLTLPKLWQAWMSMSWDSRDLQFLTQMKAAATARTVTQQVRICRQQPSHDRVAGSGNYLEKVWLVLCAWPLHAMAG